MAFFSKLSALFGGKKEKYVIFGEQGGISSCITLPKGFNPSTDKCRMAILMHGFMASKRFYPIPNLAQALADAGIASICFDFNAHGKSQGEFINMTIENEISDAKAVLDYVKALPYVTDVVFVGHSQGGVVASMLAGRLPKGEQPSCLVLLAPAAVLKDDALAGTCMGKKYDPVHIPEYVNVMFHKLGRNFIQIAQKLPIYETACAYQGSVCLIHGKKDTIVPVSYSEKFHQQYANSELHLLEEEGHFLRADKPAMMQLVTQFITATPNS